MEFDWLFIAAVAGLLKQINFGSHPYKMSDFDADISDIHAEMEQFLCLQARQKDTRT